MATLFALLATILTSWLPILNKQMLRDVRPALVAWVMNAASLPLLAIGTLLLTQCRFMVGKSISFACFLQVPHVDSIFLIALCASVLLNWAATLLSTSALAKADASFISPLLTFNPAFTFLIAWLALKEVPGVVQTIGVVLVVFGAYLLEVEEVRTGLLDPLRVLVRRPGALLAMSASALWGMTTVLEKLAIEHSTPSSGPLVAFLGTFLMVLLLTPGALRTAKLPSEQHSQWKGLRLHKRAMALAVLIAGIAPLFGFTAIALGLVGYVTTIFKLSAVFTIGWAYWVLNEKHISSRFLGAGVMIVGGILLAI